MINSLYSNCQLSTITSVFTFMFFIVTFLSVISWKLIVFTFIYELIEENEEDEKLDEEEKHNVITGENPLSGSQTKQKDLKKRIDKKYFTWQAHNISHNHQTLRSTWSSTLERKCMNVIKVEKYLCGLQIWRSTWTFIQRRNNIHVLYVERVFHICTV